MNIIGFLLLIIGFVLYKYVIDWCVNLLCMTTLGYSQLRESLFCIFNQGNVRSDNTLLVLFDMIVILFSIVHISICITKGNVLGDILLYIRTWEPGSVRLGISVTISIFTNYHRDRLHNLLCVWFCHRYTYSITLHLHKHVIEFMILLLMG